MSAKQFLANKYISVLEYSRIRWITFHALVSVSKSEKGIEGNTLVFAINILFTSVSSFISYSSNELKFTNKKKVS